MAEQVIEVRGLAKRFGGVQVVTSVNFDTRPGELFNFFGPDEAGKTATINMLTGLACPDVGTIYIAGINRSVNPKAAQRLMDVVPNKCNPHLEPAGWENLCFSRLLHGMNKRERMELARELLDSFSPTDAAGRIVRSVWLI